MSKVKWRILPLLLFLCLVIFFMRSLFLDPHYLPSVQIGKAMPRFHLATIDKKDELNTSDFKGHLSLLNVWASWCASCEEEQAFLLKLAREGILIYGLNYKDQPHEAQKWLKDFGNPYQKIGEDSKGRVAIHLGVYGTPETFLIDKKGIIQYRHVGVLTERTWDSEFIPIIKSLQHHE